MTDLQEAVNKLTNRRGQIKGSLTRFINYMNKPENVTPENYPQMKLRSDKIALLWNLFDNVQSELEYLTECDEPTSNAERNSFEESYFHAMAYVENLSSTIVPNQTLNASAASDNEDGTVTRRNLQVKLPQIDLPKFNGMYDKWMCFHDSFVSLIHNNAELTLIQKFQYLKSALTDEPANTIDSIDITADNYMVAWLLLNERYQNSSVIIKNHLRDLFNLASVKRDNPQSLRKLIDDTQRHLRCLKNLKQPVEHWDLIIIHLITTKLDHNTLSVWETHSAVTLDNALPTLDALIGFLNKKCQASEALVAQISTPHSFKPGNILNQKRTQQNTCVTTNTTSTTCIKCNKGHKMHNCFSFKKLSHDQKIKFVKDHKLCQQCLSKHDEGKCLFHSCYICKHNHHHLLHKYEPVSKPLSSGTRYNNSPSVESQNNVSMHSNAPSTVLLSTAIVYVFSASGRKLKCRALLDSGSQSNFMSHELFKNLSLDSKKCNVSIGGINLIKTNIEFSTTANIQSLHNTMRTELGFLVIENIVDCLPTIAINKVDLKIPSDLLLADSDFSTPQKIDMLLGAEIFYQSLCAGQIRLKSGPVLQETHFGWILSGPIYNDSNVKQMNFFSGLTVNPTFGQNCCDLENLISRFWQLDQIQSPSSYSPTEKYCEELYNASTKRDLTGRYYVKLPLKDNVASLGDSYHLALRRLLLLEKRFNRDSVLAEEYKKFMHEYLSLGHMSPVQKPTSHQSVPPYYLPHHAVFKGSSSTTKMRVVFDGSAKSSSGLSLNDILHTGPNLQRDIVEVLIRFRRHSIAIVADVEKMYRQINVHRDFTNLQRILWRFDPNDEIRPYTLNTVTYGTACAAYLAIKTFKQLAIDESSKFETAANVVLNDFYVDDLLSGTNTYDDALILYKELNKLMQRGGFALRKWSSNNVRLMSHMSPSNTNTIRSIYSDPNTKTLGINWNLEDDTLRFENSFSKLDEPFTKRTLLSSIARLFDPLGLLGPIILSAKLIMQRLWQLKCNWDEIVPQNIADQWRQYASSMSCIADIRIPRRLSIFPSPRYELHGFCDASEVGYGSCVYLRSIYNGQCCTQLIGSKSRVAPLTRISIPRLELCGALLLANLMEKISNAIDLTIASTYLWTDSMIVLHWLNRSSHIFKTFVANRISEIQQLTKIADWYHVSSNDNPADYLSRGLLPHELVVCTHWWTGPEWLLNINISFSKPEVFNCDTQNLLETRTVLAAISNQHDLDIFMKFSSFPKLVRIVAYILRFTSNALKRSNSASGHLSIRELSLATVRIILVLQGAEFSKEIRDIKSKGSVACNSKIVNLNPFLDATGLIRVGGRIVNSDLPYNAKHPILLPKHFVTTLLLRNSHMVNLHAPPQLLLSIIRQKYWPLSGRNIIRNICRSCITCFRTNPPINNQIMGNLPMDRVVPSRPFSSVGVDYCGPFDIKPMIRSKSRLKLYIVIFVCFATKALHLEVAFNLSTIAFLHAFQKFVSRRGVPCTIWSDNATNFVGANRELKKFLTSDHYKNDLMTVISRKHQIEWRFIPARSPHMGGLWEAGVRAVKYHFYRVARNLTLNYDDFITIVIQIEGLLNCRPLCPMSSDPSEFNVLTPNHFLIGCMDSKIEISTNNITHFRHLLGIRQHFWNRWSKEYIHNLQQRPKWKLHKETTLKIGDLALLVDNNSPPGKWTVGRITKLHPGADSVIRVVTLRTRWGEVKRAICKIAVFPNPEIKSA